MEVGLEMRPIFLRKLFNYTNIGIGDLANAPIYVQNTI